MLLNFRLDFNILVSLTFNKVFVVIEILLSVLKFRGV